MSFPRFLLVVLWALGVSLPAIAETTTGQVAVTVLESLSIVETAVVDFGSIPGNTGRCSMDASGSLSGSDGSQCSGSGQLGQFSISGSAGQSVAVTVNAGSSGPGISFQPQLVSSGAATLSDGKAVAVIGGLLDLADADRGAHILTYFVTVNYN